MLQVMRASFSFSAIPLHGPCLATAFTACSPECGIVRTLAASPVLAVWTTKELHRFSHLEKFLAAGKAEVAPAWNELEPIARSKTGPKKRSRNVPTSGSKPYHSLTTPFQKLVDFLGFCHSVSLGVFRSFASMQRFESARRLHLLRIHAGFLLCLGPPQNPWAHPL